MYNCSIRAEAVLFSATRCQCFLIPQLTLLPERDLFFPCVYIFTGANAVTVTVTVAITVESSGAFFNTTCTVAVHVTEQDQ